MSPCFLRRWTLPVVLSLAFHAALFLLPAGREAPEPRPALKLTLVRPANVAGRSRSDVGGLPGDGPNTGRSSPSSAPQRRAEPPRPRPEAKQPALKSSVRPKSQPKSKPPVPQPERVRRADPVPSPSVQEPDGEIAAVVRGRVPAPGTAGGGSGGAAGAGVGPSAGLAGGTGPVDVGTLKILSKTPPEYPLFSRRRREEGKLTILITIESGRVVDAVVENGSGHARLDEAALKAVRTWRFGHEGRIRARVPVSFLLEEQN